ncbi:MULTISPECIES: 5-formyltetrahydrofolate cyclo-ligase [unclassified Janthinobacterium]|uniref:5-formyltetrahydrofolate cyclo-ligase n=1 Tax=unclassified Janthinobacterium TaxID=2610881 RepID=UPI00034B1221|nr:MULTISPECIES: 5-formyltetrahydrofolate cyclo-ligase [unclassified Janthinobacterium]MEC5158985.1 5-formyltetrahydrofolate cyclo-ligase [Janthinobacterium sp. CG_S6]
MNSKPRITRDPGAPPALATNPKAQLRRDLLAARRALGGAQRAGWDELIGARVLAWCEAAGVGALAVYWPLQGEPDLQRAYAALAARGVRLALPVVLEKAAPLAFSAWTPGEPMQKDGMGVAVPAALRIDACPAAILLPCLGYNAGRFRLGYGGGYYDRTLARAPRPVAVGVAYSCLAAQFASDAHDVALDHIVTENGMI